MMRRRLNGAAALALVAAVTFGAAGCRRPEVEPDLTAMVDSLLPRLEVLSGLPARGPIRIARQDPSSVRRYVEAQIAKDFPPGELEGVRAAYAAFGLLPDTLDLRRLLLDIYTEQVVGYYDPETDSLFVVAGVPAAEVRSVVVHEVVHALQDQYVDVDALIAADRGNDRQTAAQAALEGHATLVMFAWLAESETGRPVDPRRFPDLSSQLAPLMEAQNEQFPVFRSAPRIIRETMLFPYVRGAGFAQALWRDRSGAGGMAHPAPLGEFLPTSTEQVLHPESRFLEHRDDPTEFTLTSAGGGWRRVYDNTLGQLEAAILLSEHLGEEADPLVVGWDGDRYVLLESPDGAHVLVWYSVWDDPAAADRFAQGYRRALVARPGRHGTVDRVEIAGRPGVRIVDAPQGVPLDSVPRVDVAEVAAAK